MNESIDYYCERCSDEFWAEPLNALSNVSFLIAAVMAFVVARRQSQLSGFDGRDPVIRDAKTKSVVDRSVDHCFPRLIDGAISDPPSANVPAFPSGPVKTLIGMSALVGVGSFAFHTFANRVTEVIDILPIFAFQVYFLWLYLVQFLDWRRGLATLGCVVFLVANLSMLAIPPWLNGSLMYAPTLALIAAMTVHHLIQRMAGADWMVVMLIGFCVSLCFRTIDMAVCQSWPIGTHFLWHLINGLVLYAAIRVVMK